MRIEMPPWNIDLSAQFYVANYAGTSTTCGKVARAKYGTESMSSAIGLPGQVGLCPVFGMGCSSGKAGAACVSAT